MPCGFRIHTGPYAGKIFPAGTSRRIVIGRALEADFTIPDPSLAPFHCEIELYEGVSRRMARARALGPEIAIEVEGVPFDEVLLKSGDVIRLGETVIEFVEGGSAKEPPGGNRARVGRTCTACGLPVPRLGGGRVVLGRTYCWHCVDLRLTVRRDLGRYRFLRKIGRNIAEVIYAAEDLSFDPPRRIAMRVLKSERVRDARVLRRFLTRGAVACALEHPAFPRAYSLIQRPELTALSEELLDWPSLEEWLARGARLPLRRALYVVLQLADALQLARREKIIVGRLRPHHIRLSEEGRVQIVSYWLAPELEQKVAERVGAPQAEPLPPRTSEDPEPYAPDSISEDLRRYLEPPPRDLAHYEDESLDIRPLGTLLFQLATGTSPPRECRLEELLERFRRGVAAGLEPAAGAIPELVPQVLTRCLHPVRQRRYHRLLELRQDIRDALAALGVLGAAQ
ncbi:MAG: hypothetical protein KatS3mg102_0468 [Planctomycetota bacterium]|nr:MAG: hypothetical protein KatS3mg102_0468 [Planctomycetota bacterium]